MNADRTNETFDALINGDDEAELAAFVANAIWDYYSVYLNYSKLPVECQTVVITRAASGLMGNGSFFHLFEGEFAGDPNYSYTIAAYERLGLHTCAEVLRRVVGLFPNSQVSPQQDLRLGTIQGAAGNFIDDLEQRFYDCDAELNAALARYILANKDAFGFLFARTSQ